MHKPYNVKRRNSYMILSDISITNVQYYFLLSFISLSLLVACIERFIVFIFTAIEYKIFV